MKKHIFTAEERAILLANRHVRKVTNHSVSFAAEFKKFAVKESIEKGRRPQDIFITEGIAVSIIGDKIPQRNLEAWRKKVKERGFKALEEDNRGLNRGSSGRKKKERIDESKMSDKEIIEYYKTRCAYIDAENDFLARARGIPRMAPFVYRSGSNTDS